MSICNLFTGFNKHTGNFLMFSQYAKDLTKGNVRKEAYRVVPSKFYAMEIPYNTAAVTVPSYGSSKNLNLDIPTYFQNVFENSCAYCEKNLEVFTPNNAKSLFWDAMDRAGLIGTSPTTNNDYKEYSNNYINYIGDINLQSFDEYNGIGYSEIYCYIPSDEDYKKYIIRYNDGDSHVSNPNTYIEGYSTTNNINGDLTLTNYSDYKNYYYNSEFTIEPTDPTTTPSLYNINTVILFYDIYTDDSNTPTYTEIPLGIYFTGVFDTNHNIGNVITKYVTSDDAYGMGTSYGLRICSRFIVTPNNINFNSVDFSTNDSDNYPAFCQAMTKMSENIDKMNDVISNYNEIYNKIKDTLAIFKNSRTNIPYIKTIGDKSYWFINGKLIGESSSINNINISSATDNDIQEVVDNIIGNL